jgi:hypothetical protein
MSVDRSRDTAQAVGVANELPDLDHPDQLDVSTVAELGLEATVHGVARNE